MVGLGEIKPGNYLEGYCDCPAEAFGASWARTHQNSIFFPLESNHSFQRTMQKKACFCLFVTCFLVSILSKL